MKKKSISTLLLVSFVVVSFAQNYNSYSNSYKPKNTNLNFQSLNPPPTYVNGYTKSNGTYVEGYNRTQKNYTNWDNYSTQGNNNPYTLEYGNKAKDYSIDAYKYGQGRSIYEGPRGGQYYINDRGNKVYVPKRN